MTNEQPAITPSQLDAWRRMSEDELEAEKQKHLDLDIDTILNQLIFIKRYEREIGKCWDKIATVMDERSPRAMWKTAQPPAPDAAEASGHRTIVITRDELLAEMNRQRAEEATQPAPEAQPVAFWIADEPLRIVEQYNMDVLTGPYLTEEDAQEEFDRITRMRTPHDYWSMKEGFVPAVPSPAQPTPAAIKATELLWWYVGAEHPFQRPDNEDARTWYDGPFASEADAVADQALRITHVGKH